MQCSADGNSNEVCRYLMMVSGSPPPDLTNSHQQGGGAVLFPGSTNLEQIKQRRVQGSYLLPSFHFPATEDSQNSLPVNQYLKCLNSQTLNVFLRYLPVSQHCNDCLPCNLIFMWISLVSTNRDHSLTMANWGTGELMGFPVVAEDINSRVQVWDLTAGLFSLHLALVSPSKQAEQSTKQFAAQAFTDVRFPSFVKPWGLSWGFWRYRARFFQKWCPGTVIMFFFPPE